MPDDERSELRHRVRSGDRPPSPGAAVLRGGPDTVSLLKTHATRMHRAFVLDGAPIFGISVFVALDDLGPASERGILSDQLGTYSSIHICTVGELLSNGFDLVPTFARPHYSILLPSPDDVARLAVTLGRSRVNKYAQ